MTKIITSTNNASSVLVLASGGKLAAIDVKAGKNKIRYYAEHIASISEVDTDTFRNAGTAAAGAIIGGVLTGGVGLLAGAAYGGRRKKVASYVLKFTDGNYIAITEDSKGPIAALDNIILNNTVAAHIAQTEAQTQPRIANSPAEALEDDRAITAHYELIHHEPLKLSVQDPRPVEPPKVTTEGPSFLVGCGVLGIFLGIMYFITKAEWPLIVGFYIFGLIGWTLIWAILMIFHKRRS